MYYYEVSPLKIIRSDAESFTYGSEHLLLPGQIVQAPVGSKLLIGVVIAKVSKPKYEVRPIESVVTQTPMPAELISTAKWTSQYYNSHLSSVWQMILPSGIAKKRREIKKTPLLHERDRTKKVFTSDQTQALNILKNMDSGTALLHGVTGSGKTLIYIEAARLAVGNGNSAIILVPEISLTSQIVAEFAQHFPDIIVYHSRQTEAERHLNWLKALNSDEPQVIIGPRSALFMPVKKVGLIVIDECHEPSFKQEQSPRYSALRVASILAKQHHAKLILGSATPMITDYFLAKQTNSPIIDMPNPARLDTTAPAVTLIDMTKRDNFLKHHFISDKLISAIENNEQSLIFHNRRGTASTTLCTSCGWQATCSRCFIPLTLHADNHRLSCHICGLSDRVPTSCPICGAAEVVHKGLGTKKIEEALRKLFPTKTIMRFDADTESDKTIDLVYNKLYSGEVDIIIGTQIIAKGLDLPHLRTVGVIQADAGLSLPDYTSDERTFQLLSQVIGRVGRSHHKTEVIVQSYQPENPAIQDGISQNYFDFYERTIKERRRANFPPFCYLLKATCIYKTEQAAIRNAKIVAEKIKQNAPATVQVFGPTPAFYERIRDTYRWQIIIKSPRRQDLIDALSNIPSTHWQTELDPISLL